MRNPLLLSLLCSSLMALAPLARAAPRSGQAPAQESAPTPPSLKDDWQGLQKLPKSLLKVWSANETSKFGLSLHRALAKEAVACSEELIGAQYRQDILKQFDATAHFDNCAFEDSFHGLASELAEVDRLLSAPPDAKKAATGAMSHLGRVLHAVQDFYAHSNWVELRHEAGSPFDTTLVVPVWTEEGRKQVLETQRLVSGYVWWDAPKKCANGVPAHADMAKDGPTTPGGKVTLPKWNRSAHSAAFTVAQWATARFLRWSFEKWPLLKEQCGGELYILGPSDRRRE